MNETFQDKLNLRIKQWNKEHPKYIWLSKVYAAVVMFFYRFFMHFILNSKRYLCGCVFVLFFIANSSFAFYGSDGFSDGEGVQEEFSVDEESSQGEEITLAGFGENADGMLEILEDEDVLDEYIEADFHSLEGEQYTLEDILEEHGRYMENSGSDDQEEVSADASESNEFSEQDWKLTLVNKQHPIPEDYTFELETIKGDMKCDKRILDDLLQMLKDAREQGINLAIRSPYRDLNRQEYLFDRKIDRYMSGGLSYMDAYKKASQYVTVPGASEHQMGLALDITSDTYSTLDEGFADTKEGKWLAEHSCEYGFILRYPQGKEYITSISYEPWHFRYVGVEAATVITQNDLTLEEFWDEYIY